MRSFYQTLHLLALCSAALASPCKPSPSSVTSAVISSTDTEEPSLSTTQLTTISESTTIPESTTISESATTTEPISESSAFTVITTTTESIGESSASIDITTTTSGLPSISTTSAEPSTTSDLPQRPTNFLKNSGFEDNTVVPWVRSGYFGDPALSTSEFHEGSQSGYVSAAPGGPADIGFRQTLDASLIEADKTYTFSVYVKTTVASSCFTRFVSCDSGTGYFATSNIPGSLNEWVLASITCSWSQARLDAGISVAVRGVCERLSFYIDDAVLVEAE